MPAPDGPVSITTSPAATSRSTSSRAVSPGYRRLTPRNVTLTAIDAASPSSPLDHRLEAVTGHDIDTLWAYRDLGVLDEPHAYLADRHRESAKTRTGVVFCLKLLNRPSSGEFDVDGALFTRIDRTVDQLEEATDTRDAAARKVLAALEPVEAAEVATAPDAQQLMTALFSKDAGEIPVPAVSYVAQQPRVAAPASCTGPSTAG
ncbi:hypothetical protein AB0N31_34305 [Streptomyces sp. NPDC051051]|uniref:hypothetical protein n=1 Tax=Streptomyces sp. NPDC051051 TaxID=3155666 RepID=UPI00341673A2